MRPRLLTAAGSDAAATLPEFEQLAPGVCGPHGLCIEPWGLSALCISSRLALHHRQVGRMPAMLHPEAPGHAALLQAWQRPPASLQRSPPQRPHPRRRLQQRRPLASLPRWPKRLAKRRGRGPPPPRQLRPASSSRRRQATRRPPPPRPPRSALAARHRRQRQLRWAQQLLLLPPERLLWSPKLKASALPPIARLLLRSRRAPPAGQRLHRQRQGACRHSPLEPRRRRQRWQRRQSARRPVAPLPSLSAGRARRLPEQRQAAPLLSHLAGLHPRLPQQEYPRLLPSSPFLAPALPQQPAARPRPLRQQPPLSRLAALLPQPAPR